MVVVNNEGHSIRVLNERRISDGEICVLCGWRFSNQFGILLEMYHPLM